MRRAPIGRIGLITAWPRGPLTVSAFQTPAHPASRSMPVDITLRMPRRACVTSSPLDTTGSKAGAQCKPRYRSEPEPWTAVSRFSPTARPRHRIASHRHPSRATPQAVDRSSRLFSHSSNTASSASSDRDRSFKNSFTTRNTRYMTTHALGQSKSEPCIRMFHRSPVTSSRLCLFSLLHARWKLALWTSHSLGDGRNSELHRALQSTPLSWYDGVIFGGG